ncbi:SdrD B-like domain-containing protein [Candidatus Viridilinea mediisalina]|uniref:SD-repeat containing protein B domain-containing protein n=1 Tax=Candidatus Viridilinea mediisalina TaxID=2024553 RepID=A0A2A6RJV8_9CHLR|nr:SdrD B-like domain-containing protein [Candidatus Viridilinea mediisalina]PDW03176.1 hypothetical protein CJ255_10205 [Candidatus Viridilinea mediisalina]
MSSSRSSAQRLRSFTRRATAHLVRPFLTFMAVLLLVLGATPMALLGPASVAYAQSAGGINFRLYLDENRDGAYQSGETLLTGGTLVIRTIDNQLVSLGPVSTSETVTTLPNGFYRLQYVPPAGRVISVPGPDAGGQRNTLVRFVQISGAPVQIDMGLRNVTGSPPVETGHTTTAPANTRSIVVRVWDDLNGNGIQDADEPGREGLTLRLVTGDNTLVPSVAQADYLGNGFYHFPAAPTTPNLFVRVDDGLPLGYALSPLNVSSIPNPDFPPDLVVFERPQNLNSNGTIVDGNLRASVPDGGTGGNTEEIGIGFTRGAVRGYVWRDSNANGLLDSAETDWDESVRVELVPVGGGTTLVTQTRSIVGPGERGGFYEFRGVPFGDYTVRISSTMFAGDAPLDGTATSPITVSGSQGNPANSVMSPGSVVTASVSLTNTDIAGGSHVADDAWFGFYRGSVGGVIWYDLNRNNAIDIATETGLGLDDIILCVDANSNGICDSGEITTTTRFDFASNSSGRYLFDNLTLGQAYTITLHQDNFAPGGRLEGHGVLTDTVVLSGTNSFYTSTAVLNAPGSSAVVDDANFPIIRTRVGNQVFIDDDGNGIFTPALGETGIQSVTVSLYRAATGSLVYTTTTDASGVYTLPETLLAVQYYATFALSSATGLPSDWQDFRPSPIDLTRPDLPVSNPVDPAEEGGTVDYSDVLATPFTDTTHLWYTPVFTPDVQLPTNNGVDAGFFALTEVGGKVFFDTNDNARDDGRNEPGMRGVTVTLQSGLTSFNAEVATLLDGSGFYTFTQVPPGPYTVTVINPNDTIFEFVAQDTVSPTLPLTNSLEVSDVLTSTGETTFTLRSGTTNHGVNAGFRALGSVTGLIFEDVDGSGTLNQAGPGLNDLLHEGTATVTVNVNLPSLVADYTTTTTALDTGPWGTPNYTLTNLVFGDGVTYALQFEPSDSTNFFPTVPGATTSITASHGPINGSALVLTDPVSPTVLNQGYVQPITLTARVFEDRGMPPLNEWELGDPGIDSHLVLVTYTGSLNWAGSPLTTTATANTVGDGTLAESGIVTFATSLRLPPGTYQVGTGVPAGYMRVPANTGITTTELITSGSFLATETTEPGTTNVFGHVRPATITGTVFFDRDENDLLDNDPGVQGVTVTLRAVAGATFSPTSFVTTTNSSGLYTFTNVQPFTYTIEFENPDTTNFAFRLGAAGDNSVTTTTVALGYTEAFTVASGDGAELNAALRGTGAITGTVWEDLDGDGQLDVGELGVDGAAVTVTLTVDSLFLASSVTVTRTETVDATGLYTFTGLPSGNYDTTSVAPPGWAPTVSLGTTNSAAPSRTNISFTAPNTGTLNHGYYQPISVTARVFVDASVPPANQWDDGEAGVDPAATVNLTYTGALLNDWASVLAGATLSQNSVVSTGLVTFTNLPPGEYRISVDPDTVTGYLPVPGNQGFTNTGLIESGQGSLTEVAPATTGTTNVFGYVEAAAITGTIWFDIDQDDSLDPGEPGMSGVTVELRDENGDAFTLGDPFRPSNVLTQTDNLGVYTFTGLLPYTYTVYFINPDETNFAFREGALSQNSVTDTTTIGLADYGRTDPFPVASGVTVTRNAAMEGTGEVVGLVWHDENGDGESAGEPGLDGAQVTVTLTLPSSSLFPLGAPTVTSSYPITSSGFYTFTGLPGGNLSNTSAPPAGAWTPTALGIAGGNSVAPLTTTNFVANTGAILNHGYYQPITITARVFEDQSMPPDNVWQDTEPATNPAAEVRLSYDGSGTLNAANWPSIFTTDPLTTTSAGVGGIATFANLPPGGYTLEVVTPTNYLAVPGNPIISGTFTLASGSTDGQTELAEPGTTNVFGYARAAIITGTVWFDSDQDNVLDALEVGFAGVTVELRSEAGAPLAPVVTTTTNASGIYIFNNVLPLTYTVQFYSPGATFAYSDTVSGNNDVDTLDGAAGRTATFTVNSGDEEQFNAAVVGIGSVVGFAWEDSNGNGLIEGGEPALPGATVALTLTGTIGTNNAPITVTRVANPVGGTGIYSFTGLPSGDIEDLIFTAPAGWVETVFVNDPNASNAPSTPVPFTAATTPISYNQGYVQLVTVTGRVWFDNNDNNTYQGGEGLFENAEVHVVNLTSNLTTTVRTDANGEYEATLAPGELQVRVPNPSTDDFAFLELGNAESQITGTDGLNRGLTPQFALASGAAETRNVGLRGTFTMSGAVFLDDNGNGLVGTKERLDNATVNLTHTVNIVAAGQVTLTTTINREFTPTTTALTNYTIPNLPGSGTGGFTLTFTAPPTTTLLVPTVATPNDPARSNGPVVNGTLTGDATFNQGYASPITVTGRVWFDNNANNTYEVGEGLFDNATVHVVNVSSSPEISHTVTTVNGFYTSTGQIPPGQIMIRVPNPSVDDYNFLTLNNAESHLNAVSANVASTSQLAVPSGGTLERNAGLTGVRTLTGTVFVDTNGDGILEATETDRVNGTTVNLTHTVNLNTGGVVLDTVITRTATSNASGLYSIGNLPASGTETAVVSFTAPAVTPAWLPTLQGTPATATNSAGPLATDITIDDTTPPINQGYVQSVTVQGVVWFDNDNDTERQVGEGVVEGVTVEVRNVTHNEDETLTTDASGRFTTTTALPPGEFVVRVQNPIPSEFTFVLAGDSILSDTTVVDWASSEPFTVNSGGTEDVVTGLTGVRSIIGRVFVDTDGDGTVGTKPALSGATVDLIHDVRFENTSGITLVTTINREVTSDGTAAADPNYTIPNLPGSGTGTFTVTFSPPDLTWQPTISSTATTASNGPVVTGTLNDATPQPINQGYYEQARITGTVFFDRNQNDWLAGNPGMSGVTVTLRLASDVNTPILTDTTNASGLYEFNVAPNTYVVEFVNPDATNFQFRATAENDNAVDTTLVDAFGNGRTANIVVESGTPETRNAAMEGRGMISGDAWIDPNADGVRAGGETTLDGMTFELTFQTTVSPYLASTTITRTLSDASNYGFDGLPNGTITTLTFTPPTATPPWNPTTYNATHSNLVDADDTTFVAVDGANYYQGYYQNATITLRLFDEEVTVNNSFDAGEVGLAGIQATLSPAAVGTIPLSDADGYVTFTVRPAVVSYTLRVPTPDTYSRSPGNEEIREIANVSSGDIIELLNFGFYRPSSIAGRAWFDSNRDGLYQLGEPLMQGLEVQLIGIDGASDELVQTWPATDLEGGFSFSGLVPTGPAPLPYTQYRICFVGVPTGFVAAERVGPLSAEGNSDINADFCTDNFTVAPSRAILHIDAGFVGNNTISGMVWEDLNADGIRDDGEPGLEGVVVTVMVTATSTLTPTVATMSATSDATGAYTITGVPAANAYHVVSAEPPLGYMRSTPLPAAGTSVPATLADIGFFQVSSVGGFAWLDLNEDGEFAGEPGVVDVTVELLRNGTVVSTTATAATANAINYRFNNIDPGTYTLRFTAPTGYVFISNGTNSFTSAAVTILSAEDPPQRVDVALRGTASIAGETWVDANRDGVRDAGEAALGGVAVQLSIAVVGATEPFVANTTTGDDGSYSFSNLPPGLATVSFTTPAGYVPTHDAPAAFDLTAGAAVDDVDQGFAVELTASIAGLACVDANDNGTCDAGEAGLAGVAVQLSIALEDGTTFTASTATGNDGRYSFVNLPPGTATVNFTTPAGYEPTGTAPAPFALAVGQAVENVNRSFVALVPQTASIAGTTCVDVNRNGVCDAGEAGLAGVQVQLSIAVEGGDAFTANATTGEDGSYRFANLPAGAATLTFVTPEGYEATGTEGLVRNITLAVGQAVTDVNQGFAELLAEPAGIAGRTCVDTNRNGTCDAGEAPLAGVVVRLSIGGLTPEAITGDDGSYSFTNLPAGAATLTFVTPEGYEATGTAGLVRNITLTAGQTVVDVNQGFVQITEEDPTFYVYLPLVAKAPETQPEPERLPDLVVTAINVIPGEPQGYTAARVEVTIRNDGDAPASGFWVDLYVNPSAAPNVNQRWNDLAVPEHFYGIAWDVVTPLQPGEERVLVSEPRSEDVPNGFAPSVSIWPGYFANGANKLYAFVDSWNRDVDTGEVDPNGAVRESNEENNRFERDINVIPGTAPADLPTVDPSSIPMR